MGELGQEKELPAGGELTLSLAEGREWRANPPVQGRLGSLVLGIELEPRSRDYPDGSDFNQSLRSRTPMVLTRSGSGAEIGGAELRGGSGF